MVITFVLGILAGLGARHAEPRLRGLLDQVLEPKPGLSEVELRVFSFAICLLAAAIVAALISSNNAFVLSIGGVLGVLGPRIKDRIDAARNKV